jgi:hypothetical protein
MAEIYLEQTREGSNSKLRTECRNSDREQYAPYQLHNLVLKTSGLPFVLPNNSALFCRRFESRAAYWRANCSASVVNIGLVVITGSGGVQPIPPFQRNKKIREIPICKRCVRPNLGRKIENEVRRHARQHTRRGNWRSKVLRIRFREIFIIV